MHTGYKTTTIRRLRDEQIRQSALEERVAAANLAEKLLGELEPGHTYSYGFLYLRITGRSPASSGDAKLRSKDVAHDLQLLIEDLFDSANVPVEAVAEQVITTDDLAKRLNVSTKTIARWRRQGLVSRRFVFDGRKRVGFLRSSVEEFVRHNRERVRRGTQFSQLSGEEREQIYSMARRLAGAGVSPAEVYKQIARQTGRSVETMRYTLRQYDRDHAESAIFPYYLRPLSDETKRKIFQQHRRGESVEALAKRFSQTKSAIHRIVVQARAQRIRELPLAYIPNEQFREDLSAEEEQAICAPRPASREPLRGVRAPSDLPPYLAGLYEVPLLTGEQERHLFRKMNYLKYKARCLVERLDPERPQAAVMDRIERLCDQAVATKNEIVQANLRLVVAIAKRYVGSDGGFFELVSDGNMSLIQAVEKFDFARGNKFSTYATWAIMKNFSRSIPNEHLYHRRFRSSPIELFWTKEDLHDDPRTDESEQLERERQVGHLLKCLDQREQEIIMRRFGLADGQHPLKLKEIGAMMGVTKERVRQLETRAMEKLRRAAEAEHFELAEVV